MISVKRFRGQSSGIESSSEWTWPSTSWSSTQAPGFMLLEAWVSINGRAEGEEGELRVYLFEECYGGFENWDHVAEVDEVKVIAV